MALPFALDHINLWLLRDQLDGREGWTVVDTCIAHDAARAQWDTIFQNELDGLPVLRVIVTHMHPDHIGLAHWLCERWQVRLWISATDFNAARIGTHSTTGFGGASAAAFFASHGLSDPQSLEKIRARSGYYPSLVPAVPESYHRLMDGMALTINGQSWTCISGFGHAPEHMALHNETLGVLISGDMLLPRISTNVSVYDAEPESDPLQLFLSSIERYRHLPDSTLVLPSHGKPFQGAGRARAAAERPPRRAPDGVAGRLPRPSHERRRCDTGAVQARARRAPDHLCHGRGGGAPAPAVVLRSGKARA